MRSSALVFLSVLTVAASSAHAQDPAAGEKVFAKCKACHVADTDQNKIGPSLKGIVGRTAGTHEGFKYSPAMIEAGEGGLVWNEETLTEYLRSPKEMVPKTKMAFVGLKKDEDLANVIAYLEQFSE
ncbi:cytochrome c [Mesorhizobium sp. J18]|uniref:c-type cytochrome n=1 Tax=Mesorhizobium sp. J18 TaxID=935263 RepID=UPI001198D31C|nr:cytochrome c family protein [Mesorhizobium sp. J18]TWG99465.1 cytochrome c [Mesorhizobium sp. J18]